MFGLFGKKEKNTPQAPAPALIEVRHPVLRSNHFRMEDSAATLCGDSERWIPTNNRLTVTQGKILTSPLRRNQSWFYCRSCLAVYISGFAPSYESAKVILDQIHEFVADKDDEDWIVDDLPCFQKV